MSAWRRELMKKLPEFGRAPESWDLIRAEMELGGVLEKAARSDDRELGGRVLQLVLWADQQSQVDEQFIYFCQDVLRAVVRTPSLRPYVMSLLNGRTFSQLAGYIEYLTSKEVVAEMAQELRTTRRAG